MRLSPKIAVLLMVGGLLVASPSMAGNGPFQYELDPREVPVMGDPDSGTGGAGQQPPPGETRTVGQTLSQKSNVRHTAILEVIIDLMKMRMIAR